MKVVRTNHVGIAPTTHGRTTIQEQISGTDHNTTNEVVKFKTDGEVLS